MKVGRNLVELATELQRRADAKRDINTPVTKLGMEVIDDEPNIVVADKAAMPLTTIAHDQLATYLDIPRDYYKRMQANDPKLLSDNVNRWMREHHEERRLVRALDGKVRAFLSDRYRCIENEDIADAVLPILMDMDLLICSCEVTERRLYIKAIDKRVALDVPTGRLMGDGSHVFFDTVSPAISVMNSEVGFGRFSIESGVFTKICTNLAMIGAHMKRRHVGSRSDYGDEVYEMLSDETKRKTDEVLFAQVRDVVRGAFDEAKFKALTTKLGEASKDKLPATVVEEVVERVGRKNAVSEGHRKSILARLIEGADLTRYGLHAAITRAAQDADDYDTASDLERLGGEIIELPRNEWATLIKVAA
jgi:hypothetical protein